MSERLLTLVEDGEFPEDIDLSELTVDDSYSRQTRQSIKEQKKRKNEGLTKFIQKWVEDEKDILPTEQVFIQIPIKGSKTPALLSRIHYENDPSQGRYWKFYYLVVTPSGFYTFNFDYCINYSFNEDINYKDFIDEPIALTDYAKKGRKFSTLIHSREGIQLLKENVVIEQKNSETLQIKIKRRIFPLHRKKEILLDAGFDGILTAIDPDEALIMYEHIKTTYETFLQTQEVNGIKEEDVITLIANDTNSKPPKKKKR